MNEYRLEHPKHPQLGYSMRTSGKNQWPQIVSFFWLLYVSAAEVLPDKFVMPAQHCLEEQEEDEDFQERYCNSFLQDLDSQFQLPRSFRGPRR